LALTIRENYFADSVRATLNPAVELREHEEFQRRVVEKVAAGMEVAEGEVEATASREVESEGARVRAFFSIRTN
jgi:hypothetical protein